MNEESLIIDELKRDLRKRQRERKNFESQWQLNMNFLMGNQYCSLGYGGEIEEFDKQFFWQEHEVFNHIAPIIENRLTKLQRVKPTMTVVPASGDERDLKTAKIGKKIINSVYNKLGVSRLISEATKWSEVCGSSFYKVSWNNSKGSLIAVDENGTPVNSGEVDISVCTPFEIFPDNISAQTIEDVQSIIHAKAYSISEIKRMWNVDVRGSDINVYSLDNLAGIGGLGYVSSSKKVIESTKTDSALVIERYSRPTVEYPNGRLTIVAADTLIFDGELPYINGTDGQRDLPFIRQVCLDQVGCFFGTSLIERMIPIQRAYNAVKNRKHEFLNRLSMGVLTVEDGSVDTENLEEEGLCPGKILVYRQGSNAPSYMNSGSIPMDFITEEQRLLDEFTEISGVGELIKSSDIARSNISGVALQLLIEQDETRISGTADSIRNAIKQIAQHILRLYKQFANIPRISKIVGDNGEIEIFYFNSSDISSDEIVFETENEMGDTLAQRRSTVYELLNAGLLSDENGKLSNRMRVKVLELLGFGIWENAQDLNELHTKKASSENLELALGNFVEVLEIDEHELHTNEHIAFMLSSEFDKAVKLNSKIKDIFLEHIRTHNKMKNEKE